jgi:hypothetical protein
MTVPIPPTSGPEDPSIRLAEVETSTIMEIQAPLPDLSGITAEAVSAGEAWQRGGADWADSPQGAGLGGWTLGGDHPAGADGDWPDSMSFPHDGP